MSLKKIDYQSIPLVLAAENLRQSAQYSVEKTKAQYWPTLSIQGGKTRNQTSDRSYWDDQLQLNVNAPLYQGGAVSALVQQAEGQQKSLPHRSNRQNLTCFNERRWLMPTGLAHEGEKRLG